MGGCTPSKEIRAPQKASRIVNEAELTHKTTVGVPDAEKTVQTSEYCVPGDETSAAIAPGAIEGIIAKEDAPETREQTSGQKNITNEEVIFAREAPTEGEASPLNSSSEAAESGDQKEQFVADEKTGAEDIPGATENTSCNAEADNEKLGTWVKAAEKAPYSSKNRLDATRIRGSVVTTKEDEDTTEKEDIVNIEAVDAETVLEKEVETFTAGNADDEASEKAIQHTGETDTAETAVHEDIIYSTGADEIEATVDVLQNEDMVEVEDVDVDPVPEKPLEIFASESTTNGEVISEKESNTEESSVDVIENEQVAHKEVELAQEIHEDAPEEEIESATEKIAVDTDILDEAGAETVEATEDVLTKEHIASVKDGDAEEAPEEAVKSDTAEDTIDVDIVDESGVDMEGEVAATLQKEDIVDIAAIDHEKTSDAQVESLAEESTANGNTVRAKNTGEHEGTEDVVDIEQTADIEAADAEGAHDGAPDNAIHETDDSCNAKASVDEDVVEDIDAHAEEDTKYMLSKVIVDFETRDVQDASDETPEVDANQAPEEEFEKAVEETPKIPAVEELIDEGVTNETGANADEATHSMPENAHIVGMEEVDADQVPEEAPQNAVQETGESATAQKAFDDDNVEDIDADVEDDVEETTGKADIFHVEAGYADQVLVEAVENSVGETPELATVDELIDEAVSNETGASADEAIETVLDEENIVGMDDVDADQAPEEAIEKEVQDREELATVEDHIGNDITSEAGAYVEEATDADQAPKEAPEEAVQVTSESVIAATTVDGDKVEDIDADAEDDSEYVLGKADIVDVEARDLGQAPHRALVKTVEETGEFASVKEHIGPGIANETGADAEEETETVHIVSIEEVDAYQAPEEAPENAVESVTAEKTVDEENVEDIDAESHDDSEDVLGKAGLVGVEAGYADQALDEALEKAVEETAELPTVEQPIGEYIANETGMEEVDADQAPEEATEEVPENAVEETSDRVVVETTVDGGNVEDIDGDAHDDSEYVFGKVDPVELHAGDAKSASEEALEKRFQTRTAETIVVADIVDEIGSDVKEDAYDLLENYDIVDIETGGTKDFHEKPLNTVSIERTREVNIIDERATDARDAIEDVLEEEEFVAIESANAKRETEEPVQTVTSENNVDDEVVSETWANAEAETKRHIEANETVVDVEDAIGAVLLNEHILDIEEVAGRVAV